MDSNVVIAVVGVAGVVVGIVVTYFVQKTTLERQRKWALEDDSRRIKRELLSERLAIVEEAIKIMVNLINNKINREMGVPMYDDSVELKEQGRRLQSIGGEAWVALVALDSQDLKKNWKVVAYAHSELEETGEIDPKSGGEVRKAYVEIIKIIDSMRSQV